MGAVTHAVARPVYNGRCFELDKAVVASSRRSFSVSAGRTAGCVSTKWYQTTCAMLNIRPAGRQAGPRSMKRSPRGLFSRVGSSAWGSG